MTLENDPRFLQGVAMAEAKRFEDAAEHFAELLEVRVQLAGDEMDASLAPLYLEYGSSLLSKVEEARSMLGDEMLQRAAKAAASAEGGGGSSGGGASSGASGDAAGPESAAGAPSAAATAGVDAGGASGTSGDAADTASSAPAAAAAAAAAASSEGQSGVAEQKEGQQPQEDGEEEEPEDPLEAAQKQEEQDLEIAWEILDIARVIYSKLNEHGNSDARKPLSRVHLRLGDLNMLNGQYSQAVEEFTLCLELRRSFLPPISRPLADVQNELYNAHLYMASATENEAEKAAILVTAKTHLQQAAEILEGMATELRAKIASEKEQSGSSTSNKDKGKGKAPAAAAPAAAAAANGDGKTGDKTDEEVLAELEDLAETLREGLEAPDASMDQGKTSVGFGAAPPAAAAADVLPGDAAGGGAAVAAPAAAATIAKPQVKRKAKPAAAAAEAVEGVDAKRPKEA